MSNWLLKATKDWLQPIYDALHCQLCQRVVLHREKTERENLLPASPTQGELLYSGKGRPLGGWLYRTSGDTEQPSVLYDYQPNRKAENAENFLNGVSGLLHADGYQGYHKLLEQICVVGCLVHA